MAEKWNPRRSRVRILEAFSYLGAALLVVAIVWSLFMMIYGRSGVLNSLNNRCGRLALACGTVSGFLIPFLSVALASAVFLFYRLRHVKAPVASDAKKKPHDLVQTSSREIGKIVGRDELCNVIMEDIRDRDTRRPHLLVGGVGTGKTAVLVRLTQMLGERRAIPVPIRLRDAQDDLDFHKMAYSRFQNMTNTDCYPLARPRRFGGNYARRIRSSSLRMVWKRRSARTMPKTVTTWFGWRSTMQRNSGCH